MSATIIEFGAQGRTARAPSITNNKVADTPLSATAVNARLRNRRKSDWRMARKRTEFLRAYLDFTHQVSVARRMGLQEAKHHPEISRDEGWDLLNSYREAQVRQLLTPAPDMASVAWKRSAFAQGQYRFTDVKTERIEKAIADDVAFFEAHPTKRAGRRKAVQS